MLINERVRNGPGLCLINSKHYLVAVVLGNIERPHDVPALWGTVSPWIVWFSCTENILLLKGHIAAPFYWDTLEVSPFLQPRFESFKMSSS